MASFKSDVMLGLKNIVTPETGAVTETAIEITWANAGAGIAVNDVIQLAVIPKGVRVIDWYWVTDDIDSNATPSVGFQIGVLNAAGTAMGAGVTDVWSGQLIAGRAGGLERGVLAGQALGGVSADRTIGLVALQATATAALANKKAWVVLALAG